MNSLAKLDRPKILLKFAQSLDGGLDDASPARYVFSNEEDLRIVDRLRADVDGILIGAGTLRIDNPILSLKDETLKKERTVLGKPAEPKRIVVCGEQLPTSEREIFKKGSGEVILFVQEKYFAEAKKVNPKALVRVADEKDYLRSILLDLKKLGLESLLVEGGATVLRQFLSLGLFDEIRVAIAPICIREESAPRVEPVSAEIPPLSLKRVEDLRGLTILSFDKA